jgi:pimeloyl-ACP methyl ester carboxylesterase
MGASIAQALALLAPQRLRSLVLVSASASIEARIQELLRAWRAIYPRVSPSEFQRQANCWLFSWRFFERQGAAEAVIAYAERRAVPADWFVAQVDAALRHNTQDRLGALRLPTLVVSGAEDVMVPPRLGRDLASRIPGARFLEIPEAGHSVNLEQQRPFNESLMAFFAEHAVR